jgi:hypothetical protein
MKTIRALTVPSLMALALALAPLSNTYAQVAGKTFRVTVKSSFGTTFTDCYRFDVPVAGSLTIDQLFQVITYRQGQLNTVDTRFKSVSRGFQPLSIMFYGEEIEALEQLTGEAVSEFGDTFVFSGPETGPSTSPSLCVPGPASATSSGASTGASPYEFR